MFIVYIISILAALASIRWIRKIPVEDVCPCGYDNDDAYPIATRVMKYTMRLDDFMHTNVYGYVTKTYHAITAVICILLVPFIVVLFLDMICRARQHNRKCLVYQVHR